MIINSNNAIHLLLAFPFIKSLDSYYPNISDWYTNQVIPGTVTGNDVVLLSVSNIKRKQQANENVEIPQSSVKYTTVVHCAKCGQASDISSDSKQNPISLIPVNTLIRRLNYKCCHCNEEYHLLENI